MTEQVIGPKTETNSSIDRLGVLILLISLLQLVVTVLLLVQENVSYIFIITQNAAIVAFSFVFTIFSYKFTPIQQRLGTGNGKLIFRYFIIAQLVGFIVIILYIITVPIPQPKFDEEGVSLFYGLVLLLTGATILNTILYYFGVKAFRDQISSQNNLAVSKKVNIGIILTITALCSYFVANLPLLDAAMRFESYENPIDPSVFIIHFMIGIFFIFIALGFLFVGMILEVFLGYNLLKKEE